jgi:hypothetical protein
VAVKPWFPENPGQEVVDLMSASSAMAFAEELASPTPFRMSTVTDVSV